MNTSLGTRFGLASTAALLAAGALIAPSPAHAAGALICRAHVSDATPNQYSHVYVHVRTAPRARVRTVAHYKTTDTARRTRANFTGRATTGYYISDATPGYKVRVTVRVAKNGHSQTCSTAFTPHS